MYHDKKTDVIRSEWSRNVRTRWSY